MEEGMFAAIICLSAQASSAKDSGNAHGVAKQQPAGQPVPIDPIVMGAQDRRQLQLRTIGFDLILARLYQGQGHISKKKKIPLGDAFLYLSPRICTVFRSVLSLFNEGA